MWNKAGRQCVYCKKPLELKEATKDHVIPKSKGGASGQHNIVISCEPCNHRKANKPLNKFLGEGNEY